jgi:hypothetical protein
MDAGVFADEFRKRWKLATAVGDRIATAQGFYLSELALEPFGRFRFPFTSRPESLPPLLVLLVPVADRLARAPR